MPRKRAAPDSLAKGLEMIRTLGQESRSTEAQRKQLAKEYLDTLDGMPFVNQVQLILLGYDEGRLNLNEMFAALRAFAQKADGGSG